MEKKVLRNIKRPVACDEWIKMADQYSGMKYLIDIHEEDDVLVMDFFEREHLIKGQRDASFRIFATPDDYITQDLSTPKTKWLSGKMESICNLSYWYYYNNYKKEGLPRYYDLVFASEASREVLGNTFGWPEKDDESVWDVFMKKQDEIAKNRLWAKHNKALIHTNQMMELVPAVPKDFEQWAYDYAMHEHRYLIFDAASAKRNRAAYCTHCGAYMTVDTNKVKLRNDKRGFCPECESDVKMKSFKRWHGTEYAEKFTCLIQKIDGYLLARYFRVALSFDKGNIFLRNGFKRTMGISEECRVFYKFKGNSVISESFEYKQYKTMPGNRWCPDEGIIDCSRAVVYTNNLPKELADTPYKYCGLDAYQMNEGCRKIPVWNYMKYFPKHPELEYLAKTGLTRICSDLVLDTWRWRSDGRHGIDVKPIRNLNKANLKILRSLNGNVYDLQFLNELQRWNIQMTEQDVKEFLLYLGPRKDTLRVCAAIDLHPRKLVRYIRKQYLSRHGGKDRLGETNRKEECRNICHDWEDYISWCKDLKMNIRDDYVLMPPNLLQAHDRVLAEKKAKEDEIQRKKQEKESKMIMKIMEDSKDVEPLHMKTKNLMIVLPNGVADLKTEGETLHHCVATYAGRMAKGETLILFIRRCEAPNTPFYTLEWKNHKIAQCRGMRNCDMTNEVRLFAKAFEKKMCEYEKKQEAKVR